ncbi:MAG TPA: TorF family putative porin [Gammaproteobacteria bacterium]
MPEPKRRAAQRRAPFRAGRGARLARVAALAAALCAPAAPLMAQVLEPVVSGYVTVASDYRHRGLSESSGEPSIQFGADYQHASGFFAGAWAARIDYAHPAHESSTRFKVGYYVGVSKRIARWSWTATAVRYTYPGLAYDYDYNELSATAGFRDRVFVTAAYIDDFFARDASAFYSEIGTALPLPHGLELGATLGRVTSSASQLEYTHWNVGLSKTFARRLGIDVRYHDGSRYVSNAIATTDADAWVVSASYGFRSR